MYYALAYYPRFEHKGFHCFRYRHEPFATLLPEHLPLIFPVPETIGLEILTSHIKKVLQNWQPFDIHFQDLELSWDHWLFLGLNEGRDQIIKLHKELYTGILEPHLREDLPFSPHVALGSFSKEPYSPEKPETLTTLDKHVYQVAFEKAKRMELNFWRRVTTLNLLKMREDFSKSWDIEVFELNE